MPRLKCLCGNSISLSEIPHPAGFALRAESDMDRIVTEIVRLHEHPDDVRDFELEVYRVITPLTTPAPHIYQCTACGRLAVFFHPSSRAAPLWYSPERQEEPPRLLASLYDAKMDLGTPY